MIVAETFPRLPPYAIDICFLLQSNLQKLQHFSRLICIPIRTAEEVSVGTATVTLKGNEEGRYTLALWQTDGFSYSLKSDTPVPLSEWEHILKGIS